MKSSSVQVVQFFWDTWYMNLRYKHTLFQSGNVYQSFDSSRDGFFLWGI